MLSPNRKPGILPIQNFSEWKMRYYQERAPHFPFHNDNMINPVTPDSSPIERIFIWRNAIAYCSVMDKKDIMYMAGALCIILVIALVIKPLMTGKPVNTGIALTTPQPTATPVTKMNTSIPQTVITIETTIPIPASTPTPVPTWGGSVQGVQVYGISGNQSRPDSSRFDEAKQDTGMTTYATFTGKYSGATQIIKIPFPYWELWYTVDPFADMGAQAQSLTSSTVTGPKQSGVKSGGSSQTVIEGSYSVAFPSFSLQVMDGVDPNRIVRTITPPGGLDKTLWTGKSVTSEDFSGKTITIPDPRPWKEKFYEGQSAYFFIINAHAVNSYSIQIMVPTRYIGKY